MGLNITLYNKQFDLSSKRVIVSGLSTEIKLKVSLAKQNFFIIFYLSGDANRLYYYMCVLSFRYKIGTKRALKYVNQLKVKERLIYDQRND